MPGAPIGGSRPRHRRGPTRRQRLTRTIVVSVAVVATLALWMASGSPAGTSKAAAARASVAGHRSPAASGAPGSTAPTTTVPATTTTVDPGTLPQTHQLPGTTDPQFLAGVAGLWKAVVTGDPSYALPFFFPLSAYIQVKGISDPVHDYDTRLIPNYEQDIAGLHASLGADPAAAQFVSVTVPESAAEWILPGVEYNKGSYYRVYGSAIHYTLDGQARSFAIVSMISWRGEWYVVHLSSIR